MTFDWVEKDWIKSLASATRNEVGAAQGGVGLLFKRKVYETLHPTVTKVSSRIIVANLHGNPNLTIIAVYAPTNTTTGLNDDQLAQKIAEKDQFDKDLSHAIHDVPTHNVLIVLGDFNAQLGQDSHIIYPRIGQRYTFHDVTNDNGQRLVKTC